MLDRALLLDVPPMTLSPSEGPLNGLRFRFVNINPGLGGGKLENAAVLSPKPRSGVGSALRMKPSFRRPDAWLPKMPDVEVPALPDEESIEVCGEPALLSPAAPAPTPRRAAAAALGVAVMGEATEAEAEEVELVLLCECT